MKKVDSKFDSLSDWEYCKRILPMVSRTFALNIAFLRDDIHKAVLCSYLFCRIIDTIEDSDKLKPEEKVEALLCFNSFFPFENGWHKGLQQIYNLCGQQKELTSNLYETHLFFNAERVFNVFSKLSRETQDAVVPWIKEMSRGMAEYQKKSEDNGFRTLETYEDLERYCYYVAGTVGILLKNLFFINISNLDESSKKIMDKHAVSFGLGLQMTNIIKDIKTDAGRNWCYVPREFMNKSGLSPEVLKSEQDLKRLGMITGLMIDKAKLHLDNALKFCQSIPRTSGRIRLFCLLPLMFAIETLKEAKRWSEEPDETPIKISRKAVKRTIWFSLFTFYSNNLQKCFYHSFRKNI